MEPNPFVARHLESNRQGRGAWARFEHHRERVTDLVMGFLAPRDRLCVAGAGNVNDLDLAQVLTRAESVDLVDLDGDAVEGGVHRQCRTADDRVHVHSGRDLSGVLDLLGPGADMGLLRGAIDRRPMVIAGGGFDVVLSAGVLTQLFQSVADAGLAPEATVEVTLRLRRRHLDELTCLARPGGHVILVTDTAPTSTAPSLRDLAEADLEPAMAALVAAGNFFTGTNAYRLVAVLEETPAVCDVTLHDPWLWPVTPDREHLTYAVSWQRAGDYR